MENWWEFGEHSGYRGSALALYRIACPFCQAEGNFKLAHHVEKKKPNGAKVLNFDTYECGNCKSYVMVFWSGTQHSFSQGLHNFIAIPWSQRLTKHPDHWPSDVGRFWLQAHRSLTDDNWDAAAVMARSAMQVTLRAHDAKGNNLKQEIHDLAKKGTLPPLMQQWSEHVRELGNDSAHPSPGQAPTNPQDAKDIVTFLDFLLEYLYDLPHKIAQYRERGSGKKGAS